MLFNDLLAKENIDPSRVLVIRHTPLEPGLKKVLPWLAAEHPDIFNAYQQTQTANVEAVMLKAQHVASFIGLKRAMETRLLAEEEAKLKQLPAYDKNEKKAYLI